MVHFINTIYLRMDSYRKLSRREENKMVEITPIDKNFAVDAEINKEHLTSYDMEESTFRIYGVTRENGYLGRK